MGSEVEGTYKNGEGEQNKFCEEYLRRSEWGRQRTGKDIPLADGGRITIDGFK